MINNDRIVPIAALDLISMYGLILKLAASTAPDALDAADTEGDFTVSANSKTYLASEPVKSLNFASTATTGTVYFVAAYDYEGFAINGTKATTTGATVAADGRTLFSATLASGTITIAKVGF